MKGKQSEDVGRGLDAQSNFHWLISCWPGAKIPIPTPLKHTHTHTRMFKHPTQWWALTLTTLTTTTPTHTYTQHHHSSGVSSSLSLFISVPERDACHVINRGFLNACVTHALIRKAGKKKAGAREERWRGRPGRHVEGEQSGRQTDGGETDRRTGRTWEGGGK